jgi:hypothetical protein
MKFGQIGAGDGIFRHSIHPLSFRGRQFANEKLIQLRPQTDGSLLTSVAWERYVPTAEYVHRYGCKVALHINEKKRKEQAEGARKSKLKTQYVYCGAYRLKAGAVRALVGTPNLDEVISADVVHHIEEGEIAHADLRIVLKSQDLDVEGTKTAIIDRLWSAFAGPLRHVCDCDRDIIQHPAADLPVPPAGAYSDTRPYFLRFLCIIRFHLYSWLWRNFMLTGLP